MPWGSHFTCEGLFTLILFGLSSSGMKPQKQCESQLDRDSEIVKMFSEEISHEAVIA
jgi:hypothetical protein